MDKETVGAYTEVISNMTSNTSSINNPQTLMNLTMVLERIVNIENTSHKVNLDIEIFKFKKGIHMLEK